MFGKLFRPRSTRRAADGLYAAAAAQARRPEFYTDMGVPDRIDARFELYTLHVLLLILRLRAEGPRGADAAQDLFDVYVSALDNVLRELGVGDVAVARKMRALAEAVYGRMTAYEAAIMAGDQAALTSALARNVLGTETITPDAEALSAYVVATGDALAAQGFDDVMNAPAWPAAVLAA